MSPERWKQIETILAQVMPLSPRDRTAVLDEICAHNPSLRRHVESLLASYRKAEAEAFLENAPHLAVTHLLLSDTEGRRPEAEPAGNRRPAFSRNLRPTLPRVWLGTVAAATVVVFTLLAGGALLWTDGAGEERRPSEEEVARAVVGRRALPAASEQPDPADPSARLALPDETAPPEARIKAGFSRLSRVRDPFGRAALLYGLAKAYGAQGRFEQAASFYRWSIDAYEQAAGPKVLARAEPLVGLAQVLIRQGAAARAEPLLRESLAIYQINNLSAFDPRVKAGEDWLRTCLQALGRNREAERF